MPDASSPDAILAALLDGLGAQVDPASLTLARARRLADFLAARDDVGARLVEVRRDEDEWLILSVDVDVGQLPAVDIRREELIAVGFTPTDRGWPCAYALREDFPYNVSHQFVRHEGEPVALCLSEEAWPEARLRWSPGAYIRLLRAWLIDTARGVLHREDQAVEPFIATSSVRAILPADLFDPGRADARLYGVGLWKEGEGSPIYAFDFQPRDPNAIPVVAAVLLTAPKLHGQVRRPPRNLAELVATFGEGHPTFGWAFDSAVSAWLAEKPLHQASPLLFVRVPMVRIEGGAPERHDLWAFLLDATVVEVGIALDLASRDGDGNVGAVLASARGEGPFGESIRTVAVNHFFELNPAQAADYNGLDRPSGHSILAVGAGALGSQVIANLARMGETISTIADEDRLLPHNLARHAVWDRELLGWPKASALALMVGRLHNSLPTPVALVMDVTDARADKASELIAAIASSDVVLDMAASVAVSRRLAIDTEEGGRRVAAFLSPNGLDLVLLAEDHAREIRLDHLEMALYAAVLGDIALTGHFALPADRRYARGCREISARLPQTAVALHAALAAEQIRRIVDKDEASADVWRLDRETMTLSHVALPIRAMVSFDIGDWTVLVAPQLLEAVKVRRAAKLPTETGGVLLGVFDAERRMIYVVADIPSPCDSVETPVAFIRVAFGMAEAVKAADDATFSMLRYIGEWHSHPDGSPAVPSADDWALFGHLAEGMEVEGHPPVMMIVGKDEVGVVTGT